CCADRLRPPRHFVARVRAGGGALRHRRAGGGRARQPHPRAAGTRHHPPLPRLLRHAVPALAPVAPAVAAHLHIARTLPNAAAAAGVALTFDDGPHPEGTPAILAILARE